jgi:hypothetical protein
VLGNLFGGLGLPVGWIDGHESQTVAIDAGTGGGYDGMPGLPADFDFGTAVPPSIGGGPSGSAASWYASEGDWLTDILRGGSSQMGEFEVTRMPVASEYGSGRTQIYHETGGSGPLGVSWPIWAIGGAVAVYLIARR